jgi:hypothetical protein
LATIAKVAGEAVEGREDENVADYGADGDDHDEGPGGLPDLGCTPRSLPERLLIEAAATARKINPMNAPLANPPLAGRGAGMALAGVQDPMRIAVLTSKYWGPASRRLTVSFMEATPTDLRNRIIAHLNAWADRGSISFVWTQGTGQVRVSRGAGGFWSYLGTDILHIPRNRPTMNLEGFTMSTSEREYRRVVRHEAGHTLGFPHEHMRRALVARIDREKAYEYFLRTQGWDRQTVDQQVLTPLDERSIMATPADQDSIMCYQLPGSITKDGQPIRGGLDINRTDADFVARIYPKAGRGTRPQRAEQYEVANGSEHEHGSEHDTWDESEDVAVTI